MCFDWPLTPSWLYISFWHSDLISEFLHKMYFFVYFLSTSLEWGWGVGGEVDKHFSLFYSHLYLHHLEHIIGAQYIVTEWMIDGTLKCVSSTHACIPDSQVQSCPDPTCSLTTRYMASLSTWLFKPEIWSIFIRPLPSSATSNLLQALLVFYLPNNFFFFPKK